MHCFPFIFIDKWLNNSLFLKIIVNKIFLMIIIHQLYSNPY